MEGLSGCWRGVSGCSRDLQTLGFLLGTHFHYLLSCLLVQPLPVGSEFKILLVQTTDHGLLFLTHSKASLQAPRASSGFGQAWLPGTPGSMDPHLKQESAQGRASLVGFLASSWELRYSPALGLLSAHLCPAPSSLAALQYALPHLGSRCT